MASFEHPPAVLKVKDLIDTLGRHDPESEVIFCVRGVQGHGAGGACAGRYITSIHKMPDGETRIEVEEHDEY
jgi:hypothetical protein